MAVFSSCCEMYGLFRLTNATLTNNFILFISVYLIKISFRSKTSHYGPYKVGYRRAASILYI